MVSHTIAFNLIPYPSGSIPVTEVLTGEDVGYIDGYNDKWTNSIKKDMIGSVGMPLSV
jgi:hypothetical protein